VHAVSEIGEFDLILESEKDVLRLDVAVEYIFGVHVAQRVGDLGYVLRSRVFVETTLFLLLQAREQAAARRIFEDEVDVLVVVEPGEQFENVLVCEVLVDFDFAADQTLFGFVGGLRFGDDFEGANVVCSDVPREEDAAEFAFAESGADFEVACGEGGGRLQRDVWSGAWCELRRGGFGAGAAFNDG
jgi:hypothetical protein